jgi:hypothetical protein
MPFGGNGEAVFFAKYLLVPDTDADKDSKKWLKKVAIFCGFGLINRERKSFEDGLLFWGFWRKKKKTEKLHSIGGAFLSSRWY